MNNNENDSIIIPNGINMQTNNDSEDDAIKIGAPVKFSKSVEFEREPLVLEKNDTDDEIIINLKAVNVYTRCVNVYHNDNLNGNIHLTISNSNNNNSSIYIYDEAITGKESISSKITNYKLDKYGLHLCPSISSQTLQYGVVDIYQYAGNQKCTLHQNGLDIYRFSNSSVDASPGIHIRDSYQNGDGQLMIYNSNIYMKRAYNAGYNKISISLNTGISLIKDSYSDTALNIIDYTNGGNLATQISSDGVYIANSDGVMDKSKFAVTGEDVYNYIKEFATKNNLTI